MNSYDFEKISGGRDSIYISDINEIPTLQKSNEDAIRNTTTKNGIIHNGFWVQRYEQLILRADYPYFKTDIPSSFTLEEQSHIKRFFLSLDAYIESPRQAIPEKEILYGSIRLDYASYLKKVRTKSFLIQSYSITCEEADWWKDIPSYVIYDIGDIFNYAYLISYENSIEDFKLGNVPIEVDPETVEKFRSTLEELLPDEGTFEITCPEEILLENSGSSIYENGKTTPLYRNQKIKPSFSSKRGRAKRCVINIGPENTRDTCINSLDDLRTIKLIEQQVSNLIHQTYLSKYTVDFDTQKFNTRYRKFCEKGDSFYCRDFQKEGITKPRYLLTLMLEVLNDKYPYIPAFQCKDFYEYYMLDLEDGTTYRPIRGHGLGMANALTTLMQITIFFLTLKSTDSNDFINTHALFLNDDACISFRSKEEHNEHLLEFRDEDIQICKDLGLLTKLSKTFFSDEGCVFVEKYFIRRHPDISRKVSYQLRELKLPLMAINIVHAKSLFSSLVNVEIEFANRILESLILYWGYEFFQKEYLYPTIFGGWMSNSVYGVSMDIKVLDTLKYNSQVSRAYFACKHNFAKVKDRGKENYKSVLERLYPIDRNSIDIELRKTFDLVSQNQVNQKYIRMNQNINLINGSFIRLARERKKAFFVAPVLTYRELITDVVRSYTDKDFFPIPMMEDGNKYYIKQSFGEIPDYYRFKNAKMGYLKTKGINCDIEADPYSIFLSKDDSVRDKLSADQRKRLCRYIGILNLNGKLNSNTFWEPQDEESNQAISRNYINPNIFCKCYGDLEINYVPGIKPEFRSPLIKRKEEVYGGFLTLQEKDFLLNNTEFFKDRKELIRLIRSYDSFEEFESIYQEFLDLSIIKKEISNSPSSESSESSMEDVMSPPDSDVVLTEIRLDYTNNEIDELIIQRTRVYNQMSDVGQGSFDVFLSRYLRNSEEYWPLHDKIMARLSYNRAQISESESSPEEDDFNSMFND